jgi:hypothetical protein
MRASYVPRREWYSQQRVLDAKLIESSVLVFVKRARARKAPIKIGRRKLVRRNVKANRQIQPQEEFDPGKASPCGCGGDPVAEA